MLKPATDVANYKQALVTERPMLGNEKATIHSTKVVTQTYNCNPLDQ